MLPPACYVSTTINQSGARLRVPNPSDGRQTERGGRPMMSVCSAMSSVMQELLAQSSFDKLKEGAIVPGTITEIRQNEVVVDIGGKSEGVIPANEFIDIGELQIGSTIEVMVEKLEDKSGAPVLSFDKAEQKKNWDNILTKFPEGSVATGRVKAKVKG